ncbi:MAG: hypothetical protein JSW39_22355 [Desulfobacterales bacterium]|nr:MAG: hypothetical protein JSW39_22355 [Desulfobacterales bacterium]
MKAIEKLIDQMEPEAAMETLASIVRKLFSHVGEKARLDFVYALTGETEAGSVPDLVHL